MMHFLLVRMFVLTLIGISFHFCNAEGGFFNTELRGKYVNLAALPEVTCLQSSIRAEGKECLHSNNDKVSSNDLSETAYEKNPWLRVDLNSFNYINHVRVWVLLEEDVEQRNWKKEEKESDSFQLRITNKSIEFNNGESTMPSLHTGEIVEFTKFKYGREPMAKKRNSTSKYTCPAKYPRTYATYAWTYF